MSSQSPKACLLDERLPDDYFNVNFMQYSPAAADGTTKQTCQLTAAIGVAAVKQIDCVIFDIGNVLVCWDPRNLYKRMGNADVETTSILAKIGLLEVNHRVLDVGEAFHPTFDALVARFPRHAEFIRAFHTRWIELLGGAINASVDIMQELKRKGVPIHAISNYNREKFDIATNSFSLPE